MATANKKLIPCKFGPRCNKGDNCQYAHPKREVNSSPFPLLPKYDTRSKVTSRPQSHTRRAQSSARDSATISSFTPNRKSRSNSRNPRANSKVRQPNPIESIDHSSLSLEQIKKNIQNLYEVCIVQFGLFFNISKCFI